MGRKPLVYFIFAALLILLGRVPAIIAPPWDIDEGLYAKIGQALSQGQLLYRGVWDNKPPALYFLFSWIGTISSDPSAYRLAATLFLIATAGVIFLIARHAYRDTRANWALAIFSFLAVVPILETNVSNAEIFFLLPTSLAILLTTLIEWGRLNRRGYLAVGVLLGLGFLFKVVVVFDALAIVSLLVLRYGRQIMTQLGYLVLGGAMVLIGPGLYLLSSGLVPDFIRAAFLNNFGYVGSGNLVSVSALDINNPWVTVTGKIVSLAAALWAVRTQFKKEVTPVTLFYLWLTFTLFGALLSGRPYLHYLIASMGALSLLIPDLFGNVWPLYKITKISPINWFKGTAVILGVAAALVLGFWGKVELITQTPELTRITQGYYANAFGYLTGKISQADFYSFFGPTVGLNFELSDYLKTHTVSTDRVFIWGNAPWVYYLADRENASRYLVAYQVNQVKEAAGEIASELSSQPPEVIVETNEPTFIGKSGSPTPAFPWLDQFVRSNYRLVDRIGAADIYRLNLRMARRY